MNDSISILATQPVALQEVDRTTAIKIASWTILGTTVVVFFARQIMKAFVFRRFALDDLFILLATIFAIGLSITSFILASEGLGFPGLLTIERANILMKGFYASEFLYISSLCFAKLSILVLFHNIVITQRLHRRFVVGFGGFIVAWSIGSMLGVAFQCELPRPWEVMTLRCFNSQIFWMVYCIIDMSTEVSIIMLSVNIVAYLRVRLIRKIAVVACFAPRALVVTASLVRLIWLYPITPHVNPQYRLWLPLLITQVQVCLSICTACIPYMVPFFKSLEGNLRRTQSIKSRDIRLEEGYARSRSSLWFRRQKKAEVFHSWDSVAVASLQYERVPEVSPHIPTPTPMSPMTPPRLHTPSTRSPSERGLSIRIPDRDSQARRTADITSPQTASSFALSPTCTSPQPLLSQSFIPTRKAPTPPPKTHSPYPPTASSNYSSAVPTPTDTPRTQRFSLFPSQRSKSRSPQPPQGSFPSPSIPPIRAMRSQTMSGTTRHPTVLRPYHPSDRSASPSSAPKFSTAPQPRSPPPTTTTKKSNHLQRPQSVQDLTSPMGNAINNYFNSDAPNPPPVPHLPPPSSQRQRNQQVLLPSNSSRGATSPPPSATHARKPSPQDIIRDELFLPRDSLYMTRTSRSQTVPAIGDVRNSPQIVVRSPQ